MKRPAWLVVAGVVTLSGTGAAFDSKCRVADGAECEAGPDAARHRWNAHDSEHAQIWERVVGSMGLPLHLRGTIVLRVPTVEAQVAGVATLQPHPFAETAVIAERHYAISEMTQLPDLAYSLWDWAMGNEVCPIGPLQSVRDCHSFTTHMGTLNSSHFLPQAENWYRHYHELAVERASVCGNMRSLLGASFFDYVEQCDQQAFTFEAIAHHYLQDAWSMGHMWARWGGPQPGDFGDNWRERGLLVALSAGLIHGSKGVVQGLLDTNEWVARLGLSEGRVDVRDAMCAPLDPRDFSCDGSGYLCVGPEVAQEPSSYIDGVDGSKHRGIGDLYATEFATSQTYSAPWGRLVGCAESSIQDVADAAGIPVTANLAAPTPPSAEFSEACFGQRATNSSVWLGAGIDAVIEDVDIGEVGVDLPLIGYVKLRDAERYTVYVRVPLNPLLAAQSIPFGLTGGAEASPAEVVVAISETEGKVTISDEMKARFRLDLAGIADFVEDRGRSNPDGTDAATDPPALMGVNPNGSPEYQHEPPADYNDPILPYVPSFSSATGFANESDRADVLARAYHKGFATEWCTVTTPSDLESLKTAIRGPLCEVCGEFAGRHLRLGTEGAFDGEAISLCDSLEREQSAIYLDLEDYEELTWQERGEIWCGCRAAEDGAAEGLVEGDDAPEDGAGCEGRFAGRIIDAVGRQAVAGARIAYGADLSESDGDGLFTSALLPCGNYEVTVEAEGYLRATLRVGIDEAGAVVQLVELKALQEGCEGGLTTVSGRVLDGLTGAALVQARVEVFQGPGAGADDRIVETALTSAEGAYLMDALPGGYYTLRFSADGYAASGPREISACRSTSEDVRDVHLIPNGAPGLSFVLNWARPADLDLHLLLPSGEEVAFGACAGSIAAEPYAEFEVDHLEADGPESIRVVDVVPGVYTLYVHNFSAQNGVAEGLDESEAEVVVYEGSVPIRVFPVPGAGSGYFWDVLEFEGSIDSLELRTLGRLTDDRANPYAEGEYSAACTPRGP